MGRMSTQDNDDDRIALLQGTLDLLILKTLILGPCHGQGVARMIQRQSEDVFLVDHGSLYVALQRLEDKEWIRAKWGVSENNRKARFYSLTPKGRAQLVEKTSEWRRLTRAMGLISRSCGHSKSGGIDMFRRKRSAEDFAEEIKAHLALEADDLEREGLSEDEARRTAHLEFGGVRAAHERFYMRDRWIGLDKLGRDLRFGLRSLRQSPGFAVTAILTLALGVGANTAVFSVMNAVLLRSLPVADPNRLVYLRISNPPRGTGTIDSNRTFSYSVYDALRKQTGGVAPLMAYVPLSGSKVAVRYGAQPEEAEGDMVSGAFFSGLGVKLPLGRGFSELDETKHAPIQPQGKDLARW